MSAIPFSFLLILLYRSMHHLFDGDLFIIIPGQVVIFMFPGFYFLMKICLLLKETFPCINTIKLSVKYIIHGDHLYFSIL